MKKIFTENKTFYGFQDKEISNETLFDLYEMVKNNATSFNCQPLRITFVKSKEVKQKLDQFILETNKEKTMNAPVTAILSMDLSFYKDLPINFPAMDVSFLFKDNPDFTYQTAFRNSSLQGGYFIKAAHALGLGTGPMSGFDNNGLDEEFFKGKNWKSNFLCNLGYGDETQTRPRAPRYKFDEIVEIL
tara:strand:- start:719 stop:1282 length:564 start_codon:yes stop_codon:yes gene_type:complete